MKYDQDLTGLSNDEIDNIRRIKHEQKRLMEDSDQDSLDSEGYDKQDPYAEAAKRADKMM